MPSAKRRPPCASMNIALLLTIANIMASAFLVYRGSIGGNHAVKAAHLTARVATSSSGLAESFGSSTADSASNQCGPNMGPLRVHAGRDNPLWALFDDYKSGALVDKWEQYFDVYNRYFAKYVGKEVHFLEIGVQSGGSIELWKAFFGPGLRYYGVDINPYTEPLFASQGPPRVQVIVGSQSNRTFLPSQVLTVVPKLDIVLDDGGHTMEQQIVAFEELYQHVKQDGLYMVEDCATSYNPEFGGGFMRANSWIEYSKHLIDTALHADHFNGGAYRNSVAHSTMSIAYFDQMVVFEKGIHIRGSPTRRGDMKMDYAPPTNDGAVDVEVLKTLQRLYNKIL